VPDADKGDIYERVRVGGAQACIDVVPKNAANFNVDNVRVVKIAGGGAHDSRVVKGVVIKRGTEGSIKDVTDAKVAVFAQGVDTSSTETKVPTSTPSHCLCKGPFPNVYPCHLYSCTGGHASSLCTKVHAPGFSPSQKPSGQYLFSRHAEWIWCSQGGWAGAILLKTEPLHT
jgi:hypothetical protein